MSVNISPAGKSNLAALLFLREYLDNDGLLKNDYKDSSHSSPLDENGVQKVNDEQWDTVIGDNLNSLTEIDKQEFITLFGLKDADGNVLQPDKLRARHISEQILKDKSSAKDLAQAVNVVWTSTSFSNEGEKKLIALLFLREYLDYDGLLKNDYGTAGALSPLSSSAVTDVNQEKWDTVIDDYLNSLVDADKQEFINLFGLKDAENNVLTPANLRARHISDQILTQKYNSDDLFDALCKIEYYGLDICQVAPPPPAEEPFALEQASSDAIWRNAQGKQADASKEPDNWGYNFDKWLERNPVFPDITLRLGYGVDAKQGPNRSQVGEPDSERGITSRLEYGAVADWRRIRLSDKYQLRPALFVDGTTSGSDPDLDGPNYKELNAGGVLAFRPLSRSYAPDIALSGFYHNYESDKPMLPHPNEEGVSLAFHYGQPIGVWDGGSISLVGDGSMFIGERNNLEYTRYLLVPSLRLQHRTFYLQGGARFGKEESGAKLTPISEREETQENGSKGLGGAIGVGPVHLKGYYDEKEKFHDEAGASLEIDAPVGGGMSLVLGGEGSIKDIRNGKQERALGELKVRNIPLMGSRDGYGVFLDVGGYAGAERLVYDPDSGMQDGGGAVGGGMLTMRFGRSESRDRSDEARELNPVSSVGANQARITYNQYDKVMRDPTVRALFTGSMFSHDVYAAAEYLTAFKLGKLNPDYTYDYGRDDYVSMTDEDYKSADATEWSSQGYKTSDEVEIGDVAPVAFYVGEETPNGKDAVQMADYYRKVYTMTQSKKYVLELAAARKQLVDSGMQVDLPSESTDLAGSLIHSVSMFSNNAEVNLGWGQKKFEAQLGLELKAQVVGPTVMLYAKAILMEMYGKINGSISPAESDAIRDSALDTRAVEYIMAYVAKADSDSTQILPTLDEMKAQFGISGAVSVVSPPSPTDDSGQEINVLPF